MKKLIIIFFLLISFPAENHAQGNYKRVIDSLKKELYKNHDSYKNIFLHYRISFVSMDQGDFLMANNYFRAGCDYRIKQIILNQRTLNFEP